jgi:hypothetical protein
MWYGGRMNKHNTRLPAISLKSLYPWLTDAELTEVEERLDRYVLLGIDIYESLERDPKRMREFEELVRE